MRILYLGDIVGKPGRAVVGKLLPRLRIDHDIDIVIAQSENITHGKGLSLNHFNELRRYGVDIFTGGNHSFERKDNCKLVSDDSKPVTAPGNLINNKMPLYKIVTVDGQKIFIASILGTIYPDRLNDIFLNAFVFADKISELIKNIKPDISVINYHGDLSSEKVSIGHYLDGIVDLVVGDHWHVPSADARILPNGTAHISDVGMVGTLNSSLGASLPEIYQKIKGNKAKMKIEESGPYQLNGVIFDSAESSRSINNIRIIVDNFI